MALPSEGRDGKQRRLLTFCTILCWPAAYQTERSLSMLEGHMDGCGFCRLAGAAEKEQDGGKYCIMFNYHLNDIP